MTKTTNKNNEFQAALMEMMRKNGMTSNSPLVLTEMPGTGEIIIGKSKHFLPTSEVSTESNRKIYRLYNEYDDERYFVSLTADQLNLMNWLYKKGFISTGDWEEIDKMKIEVI